VPDAQNDHSVCFCDAVNEQVRTNRWQFPQADETPWSATVRKHHQTVAGEQQLACDALCSNRIVRRD
jgi:hypothetical protein